jgi:multiple sugar transport system ATP-binding protein
MAEIEFDDVYKRYPDGFEAVKHFNLDVRDGELLVLVGPSGSGKSTALRMVAGLEDISQGEVRIGGRVVNGLAPKDRDIAMVFQNYALYPHMTVRDNMGFALKLAKVPRAEIDRKVKEAAELLDIEQYLEHKPANLSGGQRQRVALGRAIVRSPSAFLMDEPLSNLDAKLRVQTRTVIARIQQRLSTTTIYVTHDQTEALTLGDRIAVLRGGELQQVGPPRELYERPVNLFVAGFIGSPSMNFLPGRVDGDAVQLPIGTLPLTNELRSALRAAPDLAGRDVIAGMRPEHFEDAALVPPEQRGGATFTAKIDILESLGSEYYAYFEVESDRVSARELEEIAQDSGSADLPAAGSDRPQMVARLASASTATQGQPLELWFDAEQLQLFNPATGRSLLAGGQQEETGASVPAADVGASAAA